ncbi:F0F1 ATP synthase subunit A [Anaeroselena agilis]|uniref:ATP synthase subunit a n=1 Tax=Anaeroselena agilis TaxID=3063788 RepID=A0ABU3P5F9_9FIRM|nr:F0F1 ATP synthase subunit A [Selenomonadales bacterium 4137-cl]
MGHGGHEIGSHKVAHFFGFAFNMDTLYMTWMVMAIVIVLAILAVRRLETVPRGMQNAFEMAIEAIGGQVDATIGPNSRKVAPLLITLFVFLLTSNWLGLVPGFTSPTNDLNTTLGLALMIIGFVHVLGVGHHGLSHFKHFIQPHPLFLPINIIEEIARPITLSFRLFGNIMAGEILIILIAALPLYYGEPLVGVLWLGFSVIVGLIQAFIFTMLSTSYLSNSLKEEHH